MKKNKLKLGLGMLTVLATPIAVNTVAGTEVHAAQGWVQSGSSWYYYHQGQLVKNAWVGSYWLGADGKMVTNSWVDNGRYYVGTNGVWDKTVKKQVLLKSVENKVPTRGYENGVYYVDSKPANWWYDDGQAWYFFQNGKKLTGYGKDNAGTHYFVNGKYANGKIENKEYRDGKEISAENKVPTRGYSNGVYYVDSKPANWWYDDGQAWYFFQNGKKLTGYGKDNAGTHYFVNGKYANGKIENKEYRDGKEISVENKVPTRGYANGVYYVDSKPANWWYDDGQAWYFFQNGKKLTGYGKDNAGTHYFVNGKYANGKIENKEYRDGKEISVENKVPTRGYANGVYYVDSKPANWWYDDGEAWYFFQNGKKLTGYGKDNAGTHYFVNGKYANGKIGNKEYRDGEEISAENKVPTRGYANGVYYVDSKPANWWYDDGQAWYFFQNGRKLTGYGKDNAGLHYFVNGKYAVDKDKNTKRSIFLDPGHGGSDPGAISGGVREKDLTLSVYNKVSSKLASLGYTVLTSRNVDKDVDLVDRADQANADMLLSIHFNAGGRGIARGIETYYYQATADRVPKINKENHNNAERLERSRKLANKVQQNLLYQTGANDRGVKRASFTVLRETSIPSILVELGFIDNPEERNKIKTDEYQERLANGIVDGIVAYYK
mgnify:CR=1 FL=1